MRTGVSLIARALGPLLGLRWTLFFVWSAIVLVLWLVGYGWVGMIGDSSLRSAAELIVGNADAVWLMIAALNLHLHLAEREGLSHARVIAASIAATAFAIAFASNQLGYPLGSVIYTAHLGPKLGPVPLGWVLLWYVVVVGGRTFAARMLPNASVRTLALLTGVVATLTDLNLEKVATNDRLYWFWLIRDTPLAGSPPWSNFATWFAAGSALALLIRDQRRLVTPQNSAAAAWVLVVLNSLLLALRAKSALLG